MERKYLPTFAELIDRLSICILKSIFIVDHKQAYLEEIGYILHDLDLIVKTYNIELSGELLKSAMCIILINREIWLNESKARQGSREQNHLLSFTHSLNGRRRYFINKISQELGERKDLKLDCLAAEFKKDDFINGHGDWDFK